MALTMTPGSAGSLQFVRSCAVLALCAASVGLPAEAGTNKYQSACQHSPWKAELDAMWAAVEARQLSPDLASRMAFLMQDATQEQCPAAAAAGAAILAAAGVLDATHVSVINDVFAELLQLPMASPKPTASKRLLAAALCSGFPLFGALDWLAAALPGSEAVYVKSCEGVPSEPWHSVLQHHIGLQGQGQAPMPPPPLSALDYLKASQSLHGAPPECSLGKVSALLALALGQAVAEADACSGQKLPGLLEKAEAALQASSLNPSALILELTSSWPIAKLLHELSHALRRSTGGGLGDDGQHTLKAAEEPTGNCLIIIYTFPTQEIKTDTAEALKSMEKYYVRELGVQYPLIVFTDAATAASLASDFGAYTSLPIVPAVIPEEELTRHMLSYSCRDGLDCVAGAAPSSEAHRGVVNQTQFWSPSYLRISRYTAGPLFRHQVLDSCSHFLKIDTDFFFTAPMRQDPLAEMRQEGQRLGYWQLHVQGQRQTGYMDAALTFLKDNDLKIRNRAFYARGRFEEKAKKLGISLDSVPEATEAATVIYGCLFAGDVRFFREPLYQSFFAYMDELQGFENHGWSNQFFLGTAAAAFLAPSQVKRLYIAGRHQESSIAVANGNVTEFLLGAQFR